PLYEPLVAGRAQLAAMAPHVDLALGVSEYNAAELREAGYARPRVVPLVIEPERFGRDRADSATLERGRGAGTTVVTVSRVVPHKRIEDLLSLHAELLRIDPAARLWIVGGYNPSDGYFRMLTARAKGLPGVTFWGRVTHAQLVAAYRSASVFVSMSEHEGFGVPLIEAMACDLPVLAYAAAAVPETLGGHGIAFTEKRFSLLAELAHEVSQPSELRRRLIHGQRARLNTFSPQGVRRALGDALGPLLPEPRRASRSRVARGGRARRKVGVVISRYAAGSGGAERHAQAVAERLADTCEVTVLTTRATDHLVWDNALPEGPGVEGRVQVIRFESARPREIGRFNALSRTLFGRPLSRVDEERWIAEQGPSAPGLLRYLETEADRYDAFIFFQYLYAPTVFGLPTVSRKALLVPTAHDEPFFYFDTYGDIFEMPRALLCNTPEEESLIRRRYPAAARSRVVGVGMDSPPGDAARFRAKHGLRKPYLMYVGRLEDGKGIADLLTFHRRLRRVAPDAPDLVLAGVRSMKVEGPGVRYLGEISNEDRSDGLSGALATVVPSQFESLSLLALESFAQGTPILANARSDVLRGQVERSGAGALFSDEASFRRGVQTLAKAEPSMAKEARRYAARFTWDAVIKTYREEIERIAREVR
ncbi:MAG TPA: glycosyltransferase, partial [Myxococcaceae bacterium]|nr:glycosyltransferase [Myxococcaceae bacterium]